MAPEPINSTLYARQRIFDRTLVPVGEELLYRERPYPNRAPARFDPDRATSRVLVNAFMHNPHPAFSATYSAFVNFSAATLARDLPFPPDRLVVEVLESVRVNDAVRRRLDRLKRHGFRIALDDYTRHDAEHPLLDHADIVKLEYPAFRPADIRAVIARLKKRKPELQVLVEKIETPYDLECARAAGGDLLQGYRLHRPEPVFAPMIETAPSELRALRAVLANIDPSRQVDQLAGQLARCPVMADHLTRLAAHRRPDRAGHRMDARQIIDIVEPAAFESLLDFIEAARPPRRARRRRTRRLHSPLDLRLRSALLGTARNLLGFDAS
ncbi:EAL and HDOD domain-containing protein [Salinisphaera sp.]|uniref:EAL and HDOD domain-containing protein n=1 Tax=Salinisphaera sp. TaxID=1914330 RepID=UPI002D7675C1|nr:EAL domain-containing protein [Salinisphaera sp.]HET7313967.1 EAL domain-containing protein [Salinisphaera sp.]